MFRHKMALWGLFIVLLFTVWFGGWFVLASYADSEIEKVTDNLKSDGVDIACENRAIKGFPFRMGVKCDRLNVLVEKDDVQIESETFQTTAILYEPAKMIAELNSPLQVSAGGQKISATWDLMRLFTDAELSGNFERISLNYKNLHADLMTSKLSVAEGAVHIRPSPKALQSLDVATSAIDISAKLPENLTLPKATLSTDVTVVDGYRQLFLERQNFTEMVKDGVQLEVRSILLETGKGGKIALAGPLEIQPNGKLNGTVRLGMAQPKALGMWAAQIGPEISQVIALAEQAMAGMGVATKFGGHEMRSIEIRIDDGTIRLGFIKIGEIPSLDQF